MLCAAPSPSHALLMPCFASALFLSVRHGLFWSWRLLCAPSTPPLCVYLLWCSKVHPPPSLPPPLLCTCCHSAGVPGLLLLLQPLWQSNSLHCIFFFHGFFLALFDRTVVVLGLPLVIICNNQPMTCPSLCCHYKYCTEASVYNISFVCRIM